MTRRSIFTLSAIAALGLALLPSSIVAQQGTLRQQLVGTWTLVSCETPAANDVAFCTNPNGILLLAPSGRYATVVAARGRPKSTTGTFSRADVTPEYYKAIAQGVITNFGTWSVNEADKMLTRKFEGALFPNVEGAEPTTSISLTGDELKISSFFGAGPGPGTSTTWRRVR